MEESKKSLFDQLVIYLDTANEIDTNYNIAWYVVRNFSKITKNDQLMNLQIIVMFLQLQFLGFVNR